MFSVLIALMVAVVRSATDCNGNCLYQKRTCVQAGDYCEENSFDLWQNEGETHRPCQVLSVDGEPTEDFYSTEDFPSCFICDNGMLIDGTQVNRLCIENICTETTAAEGEVCCSDWQTEYLGTGRPGLECDASAQGRFCKPDLYCNFTETEGKGVCVREATIGPRYLVGLNEQCTFLDPAVWAESPDELVACDTDYDWTDSGFLVCDVGQYADGAGNRSSFYGRSGTCKPFNPNTGEVLDGSERDKCLRSLQCPVGQHCVSEGVNDTNVCAAMDGSFCDGGEYQCGFGSDCVWFNPHDQDLGGRCGIRSGSKGDACNNHDECKDGLVCFNNEVCDENQTPCTCGESEFRTCGRFSTCSCPAPDQVGAGVKPGCRDGDTKNAANKEQFLKRTDNVNFKCYNNSQISHDSDNPELYKSAQGCIKTEPMLLQSYRQDGSAQPTCSQVAGSGTPSQFLYGRNFKSAGFLRATPALAVVSVVLGVLSLL